MIYYSNGPDHFTSKTNNLLECLSLSMQLIGTQLAYIAYPTVVLHAGRKEYKGNVQKMFEMVGSSNLLTNR